jgi:hypothetical protein
MIFWILSALTFIAMCSFCAVAVYSYFTTPIQDYRHAFASDPRGRDPGSAQRVRDQSQSTEGGCQ